jgi:hypothetical protein
VMHVSTPTSRPRPLDRPACPSPGRRHAAPSRPADSAPWSAAEAASCSVAAEYPVGRARVAVAVAVLPATGAAERVDCSLTRSSTWPSPAAGRTPADSPAGRRVADMARARQGGRAGAPGVEGAVVGAGSHEADRLVCRRAVAAAAGAGGRQRHRTEGELPCSTDRAALTWVSAPRAARAGWRRAPLHGLGHRPRATSRTLAACGGARIEHSPSARRAHARTRVGRHRVLPKPALHERRFC